MKRKCVTIQRYLDRLVWEALERHDGEFVSMQVPFGSHGLQSRKKMKSMWRDIVKRPLVENQILIIGVLFIAAFILGLIGYAIYYKDIGGNYSFWDIFYSTLTLFSMGAIFELGTQNVFLQIARFLAPLSALYIVAKAVLFLFYEQLQLVLIRLLYRKHIIICGLGQKGYSLAAEFLDTYRVVVIELDKNNDLISGIRLKGARVIIGDARDQTILKKARFNKASYIFAATNDDLMNIEISNKAHSIYDAKRNITILFHINNLPLFRVYRERAFYMSTDLMRTEAVNVYDYSARSYLLERHPWDVSKKHPHLMYVGYSQAALALLIHTVQLWDNCSMKLKISFVGTGLDDIEEGLQSWEPDLNMRCDMSYLGIDFEAFLLQPTVNFQEITSIYFCDRSDIRNLSNAYTFLDIVRTKALEDIPINVVINRPATLLQNDISIDSPGRCDKTNITRDNDFAIYSPLDYATRESIFLGGIIELLARDIHQRYLARHCNKPSDWKEHDSCRRWDLLHEHYRESNRQQAINYCAILRAGGYGMCLKAGSVKDEVVFSDLEIEIMAEYEHERWRKAKKKDGYTFGQERDDTRKVNPYIRPWTELSDNQKKETREIVRDIPKVLKAAGLSLYRLS